MDLATCLILRNGSNTRVEGVRLRLNRGQHTFAIEILPLVSNVSFLCSFVGRNRDCVGLLFVQAGNFFDHESTQ